MSWFKKLFKKLKSDEDVSQQYPENKLPEWEAGVNNQNESSKDINAKVVYQYPKGQFRFPLIPDETPEPKSRNERVRKEKRNEQASHKTEKKQVEQRQRHHSQGGKPDTPQKHTKFEATKRRGPFRPTEIPSPIYGYKRPSANVEKSDNRNETAPIEYELHVHPSTNVEENEILFKSPIEKYEEHEFTNESIYLEKEVDLEENDELDIAQEVNELVDATIEIDDLYRIPDVQGELKEADEIFDVNVNVEDAENVHELVEGIEKKDIELVQYPSNEVAEEIVEATPVSTSERRKHIPFNVMMLNQDKQKLKQRSEDVFAEEKAPSNSIEKLESSWKDGENRHASEAETISYYEFPLGSLLSPPVVQEETSEWLEEQEQLLNSTLMSFNVGAKVVNVTQGPSVTRYEVQPDPGVKVNKITNLSDDIKLSLAAKDIRIEAPIPGKHTIGIEVPNKTSRPVYISEIINSPEFNNSASPLTAVLGLDIAGKPIVTDLRKMPHGLIAGATGSGKSVCINSILVSLLFKANPDDVKLILIDPKMVELAPYNGIPHLVSPVITDVKAATAALKWAVDEMERRYELFAHTGVREIRRFNELAEEHKRYSEKLPYIVIVIDELADLMMMSPADVEEAICRIAQKARACGIHLIIATQRPSVDVITGLIKANVPTRIAFSVSSQIDSRTIIDISGAEKLLGRGDMLFLENGSSKPVRLQGTFVSDNEIDDVVAHVKRERAPEYLFEQEELLKKAQVIEEEDELFYEACEFVVDQGAASTSSLQRRFKIGYNRAARLIDMMEQQGFISEGRGSKPREVHLTEEELETLQDASTLI